MMWLWIGLGVVAVLVVAFLLWKRFANRDDGPVSLVIYRKVYRDVTESDARGAARRALGVNAEVQTIPFDENTKGLLILCEEFPPIAVITSNRTYIDPQNIQAAASECEDPTLRNAVLTHKSWLSVDAMGLKNIPPQDVRVQIYNTLLGKLLAEFVDEQSLVIFAPSEGRYGAVNGQTSELLAGGKIADVLGDADLNAPIIHVENSDEAINTAIATAQKRLPEFISVIESGRSDAEPIVKARFADANGEGEHMWAQVKHIAPGGIVAEVMNRPANPALPKKGTVVTIKLDDVSDWMYVDEKGRSKGGFVEKILKGE
jgi:uncharacterized protein YegJ (DUF2314 family)